jgi:Tfp pilus assembly protein PilO
MKLFKTIILIAGILVAGLAYNTAFAQSNDTVESDRIEENDHKNKNKDFKHQHKRHSKAHDKQFKSRMKEHYHDSKKNIMRRNISTSQKHTKMEARITRERRSQEL